MKNPQPAATAAYFVLQDFQLGRQIWGVRGELLGKWQIVAGIHIARLLQVTGLMDRPAWLIWLPNR